jgi:hypothetical protein
LTMVYTQSGCRCRLHHFTFAKSPIKAKSKRESFQK